MLRIQTQKRECMQVEPWCSEFQNVELNQLIPPLHSTNLFKVMQRGKSGRVRRWR